MCIFITYVENCNNKFILQQKIVLRNLFKFPYNIEYRV